MTNPFRQLAFIACCFAGMQASVYAQAQRNSYIDIGTPVTNPLSKPGWNLVFNDEFSGSKSAPWNTAEGNIHYVGNCWGNSHPSTPGYNRDENQTFTSTTIKLATKKESYSPGGGAPYKPYTTTILNSDNCFNVPIQEENHSFQYGYFEIRCKNPKGQKLWPAFWLFGEGNEHSSYNELDVFEFGVGDAVVLTNHYEDENGQRIFPADWIYSLPGQTFGDTWVTYAIKWEPNKVIWYINNVPVRIVTDETSIIPTVPMIVLANSGLAEFEALANGYLPEAFPNYMEIDYIRVYQRDDHTTPHPIFSINGQQSTSPSSPISVPSTQAFLDGSQSYMPSHDYAVFIQRCDASGNAIGSDYGRWLTDTEVEQINHFNLRTFGLSVGILLTPGYNYRVKLAGNAPWTELSYFITVTSCTTAMNFKVNGLANTFFPTAITVNHNNGKPRVVLDCSASISCNSTYTVSIQQCNALGVGSGTVYSKTLTSAEQKYLSGLDLEYIYGQAGGPGFVQGVRYLVKVSGGSPVVTRSQVIYIAPCTTTTSFTITSMDATFPAAITISNGLPIILDASGNTFCNNTVTVNIVECNSSGTTIGTSSVQSTIEVPDFHYNLGVYTYGHGNLDIREMCQKVNFALECGSYYRIRLMSGSSLTSKVIYIMPCFFVFNDYLINNSDNSPHYLNSTQDIFLSAPNSMSCNNRYFISVQKRQSGVPVGTIASKWLEPREVYQLTEIGGFDLKSFARDNGLEIQDNTTYIVKLTADAGGCAPPGSANEQIIYIGTGSGKPAGSGETVSAEELSDTATFTIYPNPAAESMTVILPGNSEQAIVTFFDLTGKTVYTAAVSKSDNSINGHELATGVYYVRCQTETGIFTQKLEIVR